MIADYYFIATLLLGITALGTVLLRNPAKRVAVVRTVFVAILLLPLALCVPDRQRISCDFAFGLASPRHFDHSKAKGEISPPREDEEFERNPYSEVSHAARNDVVLNRTGERTMPPRRADRRSAVQPHMFVTVQLCGMFVVVVWQLLGFYRTRRLLRRSVAATGDFATPCRVRIHPELVAPVIVGVFRPTILLPKTGDADEIRYAIAHETAHWENGDLYGLALERLLMFPLLFHPLFWLLRRTVRCDQETLADLRAAEQVDRLGYTEQLLAWARRALNHPLPGGALLLGIAENQMFPPHPRSRNLFSRRMTMLLDETMTLKRPSRRWRWIAFGTLTIVALFAATLTLGSISMSELPEAVLKEKLKEIAPTPAEKAAISNLRQYALALYDEKTKAPAQADVVPEPNEEQIAIEFRFLSHKESLAKVFLAHPSLSWSGLPVPKKTLRAEFGFGTDMATHEIDISAEIQEHATNIPLPFQVRLFEEPGTKKLLDIFLSNSKASLLQAPNLTVFSGQTGCVRDITQMPFVTGVLPVEGDEAVVYHPIIQTFNKGVSLTVKATLLEDHSCRLDYCNMTVSRIDGTEIIELLDGGTKKTEDGKMQHSGVSIQSPDVRALNFAIPPVAIPEGMSLLLAAPGMFHKESGEGFFLLITPRRATPEPETEGELRTRVSTLLHGKIRSPR